jgi:hypothetical protein
LHMLGRLILQKARERESPSRTFSFSSRSCIRTSSIHVVSDLLGHIQQTGINALLMSLGRAGPCRMRHESGEFGEFEHGEWPLKGTALVSPLRPLAHNAPNAEQHWTPSLVMFHLYCMARFRWHLESPSLMISMRLAVAYAKWNYIEQILAPRLNFSGSIFGEDYRRMSDYKSRSQRHI